MLTIWQNIANDCTHLIKQTPRQSPLVDVFHVMRRATNNGWFSTPTNNQVQLSAECRNTPGSQTHDSRDTTRRGAGSSSMKSSENFESKLIPNSRHISAGEKKNTCFAGSTNFLFHPQPPPTYTAVYHACRESAQKMRFSSEDALEIDWRQIVWRGCVSSFDGAQLMGVRIYDVRKMCARVADCESLIDDFDWKRDVYFVLEKKKKGVTFFFCYTLVLCG